MLNLVKKDKLLAFISIPVFLLLAHVDATGADTDSFFRVTVQEQRMETHLSTILEVVQYDRSIMKIKHEDAPSPGKKYLLLKLKVEKAGKRRRSAALKQLVAVVDGKMGVMRSDDVFLGNHKCDRLPGYTISYGSKIGFSCFEIDDNLDVKQVRVGVLGEASIVWNGVPVRFEKCVSIDGAVFFPLKNLGLLLNAPISVTAAGEFSATFPTNVELSGRVGDRTLLRESGKEFAMAFPAFYYDGDVYVRGSTVFTAMGAVLDHTDDAFLFTAKTPDLLIQEQGRSWNALIREFESGNHDFKEPFVVQDPLGLSPLTAVVMFNSSEEARVSVKVKGKDEYSTVTHDSRVYRTTHIVPVYGLYPDCENEVTITLVDKSGGSQEKRLDIVTDPLPSDMSKVDVRVREPERMAAGFTFFDCPHINGNYPFAIDANGDIRWILRDKSLNGGIMLTHLKNGNILTGAGNVLPHTYNNLAAMYEMTPFGRIVRKYHAYGLHHDIREKKNGNLIAAVSKPGRESQNDVIVEIDRTSGAIIREWDLIEIIALDEYGTSAPYSGGLSNWLHNNAVWLLEDENAFVISGRHQNVVMKFKADTNEVCWWFSDRMNNVKPELRDSRLVPSNASFEYPMSQHAVMQLPDGKIMLFDNRNEEILDEAGRLRQDALYSRAVIYLIDEKKKQIEEVWQYGKERGSDMYSSFASDVDYLSPNHYLLTFGGMYKAKDGSCYDHMFTPAAIKNNSLRSSVAVEIADDDVVFEASIYGTKNSNSYKGERISIYRGEFENIGLLRKD